MSDESKLILPSPLQMMAMGPASPDNPATFDFDAWRHSARSLKEATMPIRPDIQAILERWKTAKMNNNRIIGPNRPTSPMQRK